MQLSSDVRAPSENEEASDATITPGKPLWHSVLEVLIAFGIVLVLFNILVASATIDGDDMTPTFRPGQRVLVSRLPYSLTSPGRGDVIIARDRIDPSKLLAYRVIGLPGDELDIKGAQVSLNGQPLRELYLPEAQERLGVNPTTVGRYRVGKDQYFVLKDNRFDLNDSRTIGMISPDEIVGRAWLVYWPLQNIAPVRHMRPLSQQP